MNRLLTRLGLTAAAYVIAVIVVAIGLAFFGLALYLWLVSLPLSPAVAALLVGLAALLLAGAVALTAKLTISRGPRAPTPTVATGSIAGDLGQLLGSEAVLLAQQHPYRTLLLALAAGFATGVSPELRRTLTDPIKRDR